ncbi:MAG: hypothetical protein AUH13_10510 [Acidobacteria bacterium 13_2_20CM_58_27]|nr:MAG: hypothetical protein AUH13_10510 [Acidobacteria bacterium 13_2_20CM_58_27]
MVEPDFDFSPLVRVPPSSVLDTALEFPHCDGGDIDLIFAKTLQPGYDSAVRLWLAEFGNDTGVRAR